MTPAEIQFWQRANARAGRLEPDLRAAILRAFAIIRESLSDAQLEAIVRSGNLDRLFTEALNQSVLDRAFIPLRQRLRQGVERSVRYAAPELPKGGKVDGQLAISFDYLNPKTIDAVRALDTKVMTTLATDTRESVRAFVEIGLRDGVNPRTVARRIRTIVGLAPNQELAVRNFQAALEAGDIEKALGYELRDRRFDRAVRGGELSAAQIDRMTDAYRRRFIAFNAETNARTASLDAMKLGQKLSWDDAVAKGIVDAGRLEKTWRGVLDDRERPEHVAMEGETVPFDAAYSNGEMIPGESTFNCRCVSIVRQASAP